MDEICVRIMAVACVYDTGVEIFDRSFRNVGLTSGADCTGLKIMKQSHINVCPIRLRL